jgi:hypothetical protein
MTWQPHTVVFTPDAERDLGRLDRPLGRRIRAAIDHYAAGQCLQVARPATEPAPPVVRRAGALVRLLDQRRLPYRHPNIKRSDGRPHRLGLPAPVNRDVPAERGSEAVAPAGRAGGRHPNPGPSPAPRRRSSLRSSSARRDGQPTAGPEVPRSEGAPPPRSPPSHTEGAPGERGDQVRRAAQALQVDRPSLTPAPTRPRRKVAGPSHVRPTALHPGAHGTESRTSPHGILGLFGCFLQHDQRERATYTTYRNLPNGHP